MKILKKFRVFFLILLIIPCLLLFTACTQQDPYVVKIEKTYTLGNVDIYTITYSNGTTSTFTIENGTDGEDGNDVTIESIFDYCVSQGLYNEDEFTKFLEDYLSIEAGDDSYQYATNKALLSAVTVYVEQPTQSLGWYGHITNDTQIGCGGGVIYKMDDEYSYIITNYHVVYYSASMTDNKIGKNIYIYQYGVDEDIVKYEDVLNDDGYPLVEFNGGAVKCEYLGGSMNYDIAVLRVSTQDLLANNADARAVDIADGYSVADTAIAIGNPEGEGFSVTKGIVSVESENLTMQGADEESIITFRVMRIDAAVNGGNSGGGLFNSNGELIGIVNAKGVYSSDNTPLDNYAYALPVDNITKVADNIISNYINNNNTATGVVKLDLGLTITSQNSKATYTSGKLVITDDAVITEVSASYTSDFQVGDIIESIQINDTTYEITRYFQFDDLLLTVREGDNVIIKLNRDGAEIEIDLSTVDSNYFVHVV